MKIMWLSNAPWACTGYGNQTAMFTPRLQKIGHEMAITAFYGLEGRILNNNGIPVYPKGNLTYGNDVMDTHTRHFGAEVCISLIDAWVIDPRYFVSGVKWIPWFPVDMEPLPPPVKRQVAQAYRRIVFSRFGERMVQDAGLDCYYVPHGVDTNIFRPGDKAAAKKFLRLPEDKFVVGMVAANKGNPSRKAFCENIAAFKVLHDKHPDTVLYLHTFKGEQGGQAINLPEFVRSLGLVEGKDVFFCDQYMQLIGFADDYMAAAYNAMDVHLLVSMGEGFGIPILEAQACGTPVIVGDWTSMSELCFSGWKVSKKEAHPFYTPLASYQWIPKVEAIADRLEQAYRMAGNADYSKAARKGALPYDADKVTEKYWNPILAEIEQDIKAWSPS
jgi:glycosyltransferase involved in cell wall biosynthesis